MKFVFSHSNLKINLFFTESFKIHRGLGRLPPLPMPMDEWYLQTSQFINIQQILRGIFVHGEITQMCTIRGSNYTAIKEPSNETVRWNKRRYQAQLMGWMPLINFTQIILRRLIQANGGQRTFSTFFKNDRFLNLMIINFQNACTHKYFVQATLYFFWWLPGFLLQSPETKNQNKIFTAEQN